MKKIKKPVWIIAVVTILVIAGTIAVFAALRDTSGTVTEAFEKAEVTCEVNSDYSVTNTGDVPALIRARVVVNQTEDGDIVPGSIPSYNVQSGWTQIGDYLYCNEIIPPDDGENQSSPAISIDAGDAQVILIAEAIQAASDAASEGWGVTFSDGSWS